MDDLYFVGGDVCYRGSGIDLTGEKGVDQMDQEIIRRRYKAVSIAAFVIATALLVMRIVSYYVQIALIDSEMDEAWLNLLLDAIFTVPVQVFILLLFPLFYFRKVEGGFPGVCEMSNYRKTDYRICLIAVLLGLLAPLVSVGVSLAWQIILIILGYTPSSADTVLPGSFNAAYFILSIFLTAVLPAVCEEFVNRGGLLTAMSKTHGKVKTIVLVGIAFGLFHQYIMQSAYTAVFGAVLAFITLQSGSVYPAMIIHFMNNAFSVYIESAEYYGWAVGGNFYNALNDVLTGNFAVAAAMYAVVLAAFFGLLVWIWRISKKSNRVTSINCCVAYKPTKKEKAFYIGAIVMTVISTFITYLFNVV